MFCDFMSQAWEPVALWSQAALNLNSVWIFVAKQEDPSCCWLIFAGDPSQKENQVLLGWVKQPFAPRERIRAASYALSASAVAVGCTP